MVSNELKRELYTLQTDIHEFCETLEYIKHSLISDEYDKNLPSVIGSLVKLYVPIKEKTGDIFGKIIF